MRTARTTELAKVWMSNAEAQKYLGVGAAFLKNLRATARLPFYKVGNTVFYKVTDLDRLVSRGKVI
jgi:hypothetical protein